MSGESVNQIIVATCPGCKEVVWISARDATQTKDKVLELVLKGYTIETRLTPRRTPEIGCKCQAEFDF